jgi:hypothetical protein
MRPLDGRGSTISTPARPAVPRSLNPHGHEINSFGSGFLVLLTPVPMNLEYGVMLDSTNGLGTTLHQLTYLLAH